MHQPRRSGATQARDDEGLQTRLEGGMQETATPADDRQRDARLVGKDGLEPKLERWLETEHVDEHGESAVWRRIDVWKLCSHRRTCQVHRRRPDDTMWP